MRYRLAFFSIIRAVKYAHYQLPAYIFTNSFSEESIGQLHLFRFIGIGQSWTHEPPQIICNHTTIWSKWRIGFAVLQSRCRHGTSIIKCVWFLCPRTEGWGIEAAPRCHIEMFHPYLKGLKEMNDWCESGLDGIVMILEGNIPCFDPLPLLTTVDHHHKGSVAVEVWASNDINK